MQAPIDLVAEVEDERRVWRRSPRLDRWFLFLWRGMLTLLVLVVLVRTAPISARSFLLSRTSSANACFNAPSSCCNLLARARADRSDRSV